MYAKLNKYPRVRESQYEAEIRSSILQSNYNYDNIIKIILHSIDNEVGCESYRWGRYRESLGTVSKLSLILKHLNFKQCLIYT